MANLITYHTVTVKVVTESGIFMNIINKAKENYMPLL